jgi:hydroxymethylpyrimidine/phosphomethylpyrimidine kinase
MHNNSPQLPVVLAIGGHDPGGGAGIQADIEAIGANGCHAATALTCLTIQDSCNVSRMIPIDPSILTDQIHATMADCRVSAIKIGLLGSLSAAAALVEVLRQHPKIPVVFDPVLSAGGGSELASRNLIDYIRQRVIPLCLLVTPNAPEAIKLTSSKADENNDAIGRRLLNQGADAVLITGTHQADEKSEVTHHLYQVEAAPIHSSWRRLAGEFHGSGCTLASAIAARIAAAEPLQRAVAQGLEYSWLSLTHGFKVGKCQAIPGRLFRILRPDEER